MGLTFDQALASVTSDVADIMGLPSEVGRITLGKKANMVVFDGPPLTLQVSTRRLAYMPLYGGAYACSRYTCAAPTSCTTRRCSPAVRVDRVHNAARACVFVRVRMRGACRATRHWLCWATTLTATPSSADTTTRRRPCDVRTQRP